eukprot:6200385-Pleurochrysis_carterae.AAC.4
MAYACTCQISHAAGVWARMRGLMRACLRVSARVRAYVRARTASVKPCSRGAWLFAWVHKCMRGWRLARIGAYMGRKERVGAWLCARTRGCEHLSVRACVRECVSMRVARVGARMRASFVALETAWERGCLLAPVRAAAYI